MKEYTVNFSYGKILKSFPVIANNPLEAFQIAKKRLMESRKNEWFMWYHINTVEGWA